MQHDPVSRRPEGLSLPPSQLPGAIALLGAGWLGLPLGAALVAAGYPVRATTTTTEKLSLLTAAGLTPVLLKLPPDAPPAEIKAAIGPAAGVLIITLPPGRGEGAAAAHLARLGSVAAALPGTNVRRVLLLSSTGVYPDQPGAPLLTEVDADAAHPLVQAEALFRALPQVQTTVARLAGLIGPGRHPGRFFGPDRAIPQPEAPVNLVHQADAVGALLALLKNNVGPATVNICAPMHPLRRAFYTAAARSLSAPPPSFAPPCALSGKVISGAHLLTLTQYEFRYPDPVQALAAC